MIICPVCAEPPKHYDMEEFQSPSTGATERREIRVCKCGRLTCSQVTSIISFSVDREGGRVFVMRGILMATGRQMVGGHGWERDIPDGEMREEMVERAIEIARASAVLES